MKDPLVGYQAGGAAGLALGLLIGGTGLVLKPTSGLLECISKAVNGLGMGILAWGDEVVRIPRTRIRSPRHFGMFAADPTGVLSYLCRDMLWCQRDIAISLVCTQSQLRRQLQTKQNASPLAFMPVQQLPTFLW